MPKITTLFYWLNTISYADKDTQISDPFLANKQLIFFRLEKGIPL